jgi:hypothetical protein
VLTLTLTLTLKPQYSCFMSRWQGVENSTMVVAIITDDGGDGNSFFEREFCLKELAWARAAGKVILPVCTSKDMLRRGELFSKCPDDLKTSLVPWLIELDRNHPRYWKVSHFDVQRFALDW